MACATLKRPLEWDNNSHNSPGTSGPTSSSSSSTVTDAASHDSMRSLSSGHNHHLSPHGLLRPAKRMRHSNHQTPIAHHPLPPKEPSPFCDVHPKLTAEMIGANIKEEMRRLSHRKQLYTTTSTSTGSNLMHPLNIVATSGSNGSSGPSSPEKCSSPNSSMTIDAAAAGSLMGLMSPSKREQPLFTSRQVGMICERILKDREDQIRTEYDRILGFKLAEQYDTFVKFTYEQIQKRFEAGPTPSYLS